MLRTTAFAVALLTLAACDSGTSEADDELVGSWTVASVSSQNVGVVSQNQTIIDLTRAAEGALTLSGGESGSLRYVQGYYSYGTESQLELSSVDPNANSYPSVRHTLSIYQNNGGTSVGLQRYSDDGNYREYYGDGQGLSRSGVSYTMATNLTSYYGGPAARVTGMITLGNRRLVAGERSVLSESSYDFEPGNTTRYILERDGVLRTQQISGNQTVERTGA